MAGINLGAEIINSRCGAKRGNPSSFQFATWAREIQLNIWSAMVPSAQANVPILIDQTVLPADIWTTAQNGGGDLRFASDYQGINRLSCEVVNFDTVLQRAEIWVLVPWVAFGADTPIYMWYGRAGVSQPAPADAYGKYSVWDYTNYMAVYHFENNGNDSTSWQNNPQVMNCVFAYGGPIGQYASFNGVDRYIDYQVMQAWVTDDITFEFWAYPLQTPLVQVDSIWSHDTDLPNGNIHLEQTTGNNILMNIQGWGNNSSSWTLSINQWQYIAVKYDSPAGFMDFWKNMFDYDNASAGPQDPKIDLAPVLGAWWNGAAYDRHWYGRIAEFRIHDQDVPADLLSIFYNNTSSVSSFLILQGTVSP